jgi:hypothetical protein
MRASRNRGAVGRPHAGGGRSVRALAVVLSVGDLDARTELARLAKKGLLE